MTRSLLPVVLAAVTAACATHKAPSITVREMDFFENPHDGCTRLFITSGTGINQEAARAQVFESVAAGGGNAVVFVGARAARDSTTGEFTEYTARAIAYKCVD